MLKFLAISRNRCSAGAWFTTAALGVALAGAAPAAADTTVSSNWAGYAVHRHGLTFSRVSAAWREPKARCSGSGPTYSAMWVGLGGYSVTSRALEQIGTELDCTAGGTIRSSAWYELVPKPSRPIGLKVRPGDSVTASVVVVGHRAALKLTDETTHRTFEKTVHPSVVDASSAEWILEAPSDCVSATQCQTLPLANFGSARFTLARTEATTGQAGTIVDRSWNTTKIRLRPGGHEFINYRPGDRAGAASPSPLSAGGSAFSVTYSTVRVPNAFDSARSATVRAGYLVHPGR
jgi:Peptidase A4 family